MQLHSKEYQLNSKMQATPGTTVEARGAWLVEGLAGCCSVVVNTLPRTRYVRVAVPGHQGEGGWTFWSRFPYSLAKTRSPGHSRFSCRSWPESGSLVQEMYLAKSHLGKSFTSCSPQESPTARFVCRLGKLHTLTGRTRCPVAVLGGILCRLGEIQEKE